MAFKKTPIWFNYGGVHNTTKADQGNLEHSGKWKYVTDRIASKRRMREEVFPPNQLSISLQRSVDCI
ncbi:hypothetical protein ACTXT7_015196 [Hymenolepis weldensis]